MKFIGKNILNQKIIALISLVLFAFLLVGALRIFGLYEGFDEEDAPSEPKKTTKSLKPTTSESLTPESPDSEPSMPESPDSKQSMPKTPAPKKSSSAM